MSEAVGKTRVERDARDPARAAALAAVLGIDWQRGVTYALMVDALAAIGIEDN